RKQLTVALFAAISMGSSTLLAAYLVEVDTDGLDNGILLFSSDFAFGGDTTTASQSSPSGAIGMTGGDSIYAGNGSSSLDTYVYTYAPDSQADNLIFLGGGALGDRNYASGATGGGAGTYAVYATWPRTDNVNGGLTHYQIDTAGDSVSSSVDQNGPGGAGDDVFFGNVWVKIGEIEYTSGSITVIQTPTLDTFISMRAAGVLFELMSEESNEDYTGPPGPVVLWEGAKQVFGLAFERDKTMAQTNHYAVLRSTDLLEEWATTDLKLYSITNLDANTELVTFRSMTPMAGQDREFLRVETWPKMDPNAPNYVAMTFDDGPHATRTPELLDHFLARNIRATFYLLGSNAELHPQVVRRMINEGHELGNHTMTHPYLTTLTDEEVIDEVGGCHDAVAAAGNVPPATMRPSYGDVNQHLRDLFLSEWGYPTVMWDIDPLDYNTSLTDQEVIDAVVDGVADWFDAAPAPTYGPIILMHDIHQRSVDIVPAIVDMLIAQGFSFVTVTELLELQGN
ncbi:polysaccharide deacetylase family protein, partial [bacterium]|nr:polysaccharide deacetylase family protein [bacterium]